MAKFCRCIWHTAKNFAKKRAKIWAKAKCGGFENRLYNEMLIKARRKIFLLCLKARRNLKNHLSKIFSK
ncbi:MAG: hypothetical protein A3G22_04710 [Alphaproteobacteria bacterium RIFCSPLOWO2_12_FULL_40_11]|nr:MAG: hypothetical protein A3H30_05120 [Alphaproteobacteria bacterium RIFCSPLOWO2_02_FULL_40_19]OFX11795.1 MAG: hypothetical protein A3G22_04710 [Alphaproteobacteria bacterium RIFCSPLOWO2_12_FULL_40_11]